MAKEMDMIIRNPSENVLGFGSIEWIIEGEKNSRKELEKFLNKKYGEVISNSSDKPNNENEDKENEDDKEDENDVGSVLLETEYPYFSIGENDEILLSNNQNECDETDMLFIGEDAKELLLILKKCLERRSKQLQRLLGDKQ